MIEIKGYERLYSITKNGEVFSHISKKYLKKQCNGNGYLCVYLSFNGVQTKHFIHRLVASAFIENPDDKKTVNHKNGDKKDNRVKNLEWASYSENHVHAYDKRLKNLSVKLNKKQVKEIFISKKDRKVIADNYGVSETTIREIKTGKTWSRVTKDLKC
jgi:hypothetical protein